MTKKEARAYVKALKKDMTQDDISKRSRTIINRVYELSEFKNASNIFTYVNYNQEVETVDFIKECLECGKNVYVPKVYDDIIKFHKIDSLALLKSGKYGILEPVNEYRKEWESLPGLMIMPGLAFTKSLKRVGYGGGFYDRYLCGNKRLKTVAVCFDFQIVEDVEIEDYDLRPDILVTESEVIM